MLKAANSQYRSHVYLSDVVRLGGRVEAKEIDADGNHVVRLVTWANNQRDQNVMPGTAVISLPLAPPLLFDAASRRQCLLTPLPAMPLERGDGTMGTLIDSASGAQQD